MDISFMRLALRLAARGYGRTSPNPMVGAVLVKNKKVIGRGWHHKAGGPHAEIEAIRDAEKAGFSPRAATLYVTLEPCCTQGRTRPCTAAITEAGIKRVVVGATDPNPLHQGKAFPLLRRAGIKVDPGILGAQSEDLNQAFNHWIVRRTPYVTVKAAMTLDGKIATSSGESKWITGPLARAQGLKLRRAADAILVGINTILADDPSLSCRTGTSVGGTHDLRRIVLDALARTPLNAKIVTDPQRSLTTIVVSKDAPIRKTAALSRRVRVIVAPAAAGRINLRWLLRKLGAENVTNLLVEGGGEVNASFLLAGFTHRIAFFYAPKILGGRAARKAVAGDGATSLDQALNLADVQWQKLGPDWLLTARVLPS